ncbi:MAG: hypothetical protein SNJ78_01490 [Spirochaetales bacterium]
MRAVIVYFAPKHREQYRKLAVSIAQGLSSKGVQTDLIDGVLEKDKRLSLYQYIILGCEPASLFGKKIPSLVSNFLSQAGAIGGKRSCAFVGKHFLSSNRALAQLMRAMEKEGMFLTYSEVLSTEEQAQRLGALLSSSN